MGLLQALCERGIFIQQGGVDIDGTITEAVEAYLQTLEQARTEDLSKRTDRKGLAQVRLIRAEVSNGSGGPGSILKPGHQALFVFGVEKLIPGMACHFQIFDSMGQPVTSFNSKVQAPQDACAPENSLNFVCELNELLLVPGRYRIDVAIIGDNRLQDFIEAAAVFEVGTGHIQGRPAQSDGKSSISMAHRWTLPTEK
jgi:lipopolysaccharide transport system ATP-binding protein